MNGGGFPHSDIRGSKPADGSPRLIAVCRVLHRLMVPRHPSCARIRLARYNLASRYVAILFKSSTSVFKDRKKDGAAGLAGGGSRIRTGDILLAKQTLYQLSYTPEGDMVGLTRVELVTSSLSGTRSNQLSYKPGGFIRKGGGTLLEARVGFNFGLSAFSLERR